jgi:hypothetical protein
MQNKERSLMRKVFLIAFVLSLFASFATFASAQVPTSGNVYFGYNYYNTDLSPGNRASANGWQAAFEGRVLPFLGFVADFDANYGSQNFATVAGTVNTNFSEENFLFGPRVSIPAGRFRPFAEVLFGGAHVNANTIGTDTSFATAVGGGLDYRIIRPLAWRFQGDYIHTSFFSSDQNNVRISTGIVLRF